MLQSHFSTILLMRLGSTKRIEQCYNTRTLSFGCAANWVDYSKTGDKVTGDQLECVFAHLKNGDSRMNVKDSHGIPMGNHLETLYDPRTDTYYLRFIPTLLTPAMCFYSFDAAKVAAINDGKMPIFPHMVSFLPDRYLDEMCYRKDTASFLFINDPKKFFEELK